MTYVHIIILIAVLQVVDIATTVYILRTGIGYEANPIMRKLIEKLGSAKRALIVTKVPFVAALAWAASQGTVSTEVLWVCAAISAAVAVNNLWVIKRGRK